MPANTIVRAAARRCRAFSTNRSFSTNDSSRNRNFSTNGTSNSSSSDVVIVAAKRTPIGGFMGALSSLTGVELGSIAIRAALEDLPNLKPEQVQEVYLGNVLSSGMGQAPARQAALGAGLPLNSVCTTINKVCASGMKAVMLGAQSIALGVNEVVVAGGMESMSNAPFLVARGRSVKHFGNLSMVDSIMRDGLWDSHKEMSMGQCAEICAADMRISRADQDEHAIRSYQRAAGAQANGIFQSEIAAVTIAGKKGESSVVSQDEEFSRFDPDKMRELRPAFSSDGTITAGNSSSIGDGAAVLILASAAFAEKEGLPILARIRGFGDAEQSPEKFPTSPALAIPRALAHAGLHLKDVDLFEINEAFSVVDIANQQLLGLDAEYVNIHGGAVSLGHPIGASGSRIIMSLITGLAHKNLPVGVASVCNGGGGASAIVLERGENHVLHEGNHDQEIVKTDEAESKEPPS